MIRAANHSSYPRVGAPPFDQELRLVQEARERGEASDAEVAAVEDEVSTTVVAEQCRAFVQVVTDGMVRWEGPLSRIASELEGFRHGQRSRWFETQLHDRRPVVIGPVRRRGVFLKRDYLIAADVAQSRPVKVVLPGPVTFARLAENRHYGGLGPLARDLAEAFAAEVAELATAGATHFQLDEPLLCRHPEDLELVAATAGRVFAAAGPGATTVLSTYFGDLSALAGRLGELPGTHLGLDMMHGEASWGLLEPLPPGRGVMLGLFDARTTRLEDAAEVEQRLERWREVLTCRDVIVGPQAGLELLPRDVAFDKLLQARYLTEKLARDWTWA